jgi:hypothetical protein
MTWFIHTLKVSAKCVEGEGRNFHDSQMHFDFGSQDSMETSNVWSKVWNTKSLNQVIFKSLEMFQWKLEYDGLAWPKWFYSYKLLPCEECYNMKIFNSHPLKSSSTCELWVNFNNLLERYFWTFYHLFMHKNLHNFLKRFWMASFWPIWWGNIFLLNYCKTMVFLLVALQLSLL